MKPIKNNSATDATSLAWKHSDSVVFLMLPRWQPSPFHAIHDKLMESLQSLSDKLREKLIARKTLCFSSRNSKSSTRNSKFSTRNSKLSTRTSILEIFEFRGSRIESSRSSFEGLSTYICPVLYITQKFGQISENSDFRFHSHCSCIVIRTANQIENWNSVIPEFLPATNRWKRAVETLGSRLIDAWWY